MRRVLLLSLCFALLGCGAAGHSASEPHEQSAPQAAADGAHISDRQREFLEIGEVHDGGDALVLQTPARVVFRDGALARVGPLMPGRVAEVHVRVGDAVRVGDPLVTMQSPDAASARAELVSARAGLAAARVAAERTDHMLEAGVGTEREREEAHLRVAELEAEVARGESTAQLVGRGRGGSVVLRAPLDGVVLSVAATRGASATPDGAPLVEVGDPNACWVEASVFERDLPLVRLGTEATVLLAGASAPRAGRVAFIGTMVREGARTAPVRIEIEDDAALRPGTFGRASIDLATVGITVPNQAVLIEDDSRTIVYVVDADEAFTAREVVVGATMGGRSQILGGLAEGERIVTRGALLLDGALDELL